MSRAVDVSMTQELSPRIPQAINDSELTTFEYGIEPSYALNSC
jgi:hypothetical protein